jgi:hypothetical protein
MSTINKSYEGLSIPFTKMTFSPDIPSGALGPNEYNAGENVETDIRGIRSTAGDEEILNLIPGTPTYIDGGFRQAGGFWFIAATTEGKWWASDGITDWYDITPNGATFMGYTQNTNITGSWNGTVPIYNDGIHPPFFLLDEPGATLTIYSNQVPLTIANIAYVDPTTQQITLATAQTAAPFGLNDIIIITVGNPNYDGTFKVVSSTTTTIDYLAVPAGAYVPTLKTPTVSPLYCWNYNPNWKSVTAGFVRLYTTPNVGNILVAGNLTVVHLDNTVTNFPTTVRWSQAVTIPYVMPITWVPTVLNVANELEIPVRGTVLDAFPANGNLYLGSYWDTVVFTPMNYSTTSAPILGVRLYNQGRGLLSANCWANTDDKVYGIDARDIWVFDGQSFQGIGNQRVRNWFYNELDPLYIDRVYMQTNTQKNQVEIYYPDLNADAGIPNKMISYRYDLDVWNAPRDVNRASFACEAPIFKYDLDLAEWTFNRASRTIVYVRGVLNQQLVQKDVGYNFINGLAINSYFRRDNIKVLKDYSGKLLVHRIMPEVYNLNNNDVTINPDTESALIGKVDITIEGANSVGQKPQQSTGIEMSTDTNYPWTQINQNSYRVNSITVASNVTTPGTIWICTGTTWQVTEVEDDR